MQVSSYTVDAVAHAVAAVKRRSEGLAAIGDRHSAASKAALGKLTNAAPAEPVARFVVRDRPGSR